MPFNAEKFLLDFNIPFFKEGKNVQKGWIAINCPFCSRDFSHHGGFNPTKGFYTCWKCGFHPLKNVIHELTGESPIPIIKRYETDRIKETSIKKTPVEYVNLPGKNLQPRHKNYLIKRGFDPDLLEKKYKLKGTDHTGGMYKFRIIAPIFFQTDLVSFQSRDITNKQELRYKACAKEYEKIFHKDILYNIDNCTGDSVIVTEGIVDVWRMGDDCCCTFGIGYRKQQVYLLSRYKYIFIIFDTDDNGVAQEKAVKLAKELSLLGCIVENIVLDSGDVGDMSQFEAEYLKKQLIF